MKIYNIKSPSGLSMCILAETIYHACQIAVSREGYKFSNIDYLKLNK